MRVALYARVSTEDQARGESPLWVSVRFAMLAGPDYFAARFGVMIPQR